MLEEYRLVGEQLSCGEGGPRHKEWLVVSHLISVEDLISLLLLYIFSLEILWGQVDVGYELVEFSRKL
jgi:hypothetical protein